MKAIEILKALCYENLDLEDCYVVSTGDSPWDDLSTHFPYYGSSNGEAECNATYFYYWSNSHAEISSFSKPDVILYPSDSESEIYLWKIE